jgi:hypothetical protein
MPFFVSYVPIRKVKSQLQTEGTVDTGNYIKEKQNVETKADNRQRLEEDNRFIRKSVQKRMKRNMQEHEN